MLFVYWNLIGRAEEMQQESQGKRPSARKRVTGNYSLVYFSNMPQCYDVHLYNNEQVQNILSKSIYQYIFGTFFEYWRKQFLDNTMSSLWNFPSECSNRGNSIFWLTLLRIQNRLHQMLFFSLIRELMKRWLTFKMKELCNFTFIGNLWISFIIICQLDCFHISSRETFISL